MKTITREQVHAQAAAALGLDPAGVDLLSPEGISAVLRRSASVLCPCPERSLINSVVDALRGLSADPSALPAEVELVLEALMGYGDLLEFQGLEAAEPRSGSLLYPAPPAFVRRKGGDVFLVGIGPDQATPVPDELKKSVEYSNHVRRLPGSVMPDIGAYLAQQGFLEIPIDSWMKTPGQITASQHFDRLNGMLDAAGACGEIPTLRILRTETPVKFYPDRWGMPKLETGRFLGRRKQAFGADLWCYVALDQGQPKKLLDLPLPGSPSRGCDEGWHLQMAIDFQNARPQKFSIRDGPVGASILDIFSPIPNWAQRRWDVIGERVANRGSLFSYRFSKSELAEEIAFAVNRLWLANSA